MDHPPGSGPSNAQKSHPGAWKKMGGHVIRAHWPIYLTNRIALHNLMTCKFIQIEPFFFLKFRSLRDCRRALFMQMRQVACRPPIDVTNRRCPIQSRDRSRHHKNPCAHGRSHQTTNTSPLHGSRDGHKSPRWDLPGLN